MAFRAAGNAGPLADINVTPLVDVMLVLLIIFIVTPARIRARVDAGNQAYWNGQPIAVETLQSRLQEVAHDYAGNLPALRIASDPDAHYDVMAKVLAAANNAGMERIAFVQ